MQRYLELSEKEFFRFPLSTEGLEKFSSLEELRYTFTLLAQKNAAKNDHIKWSYKLCKVYKKRNHLERKQRVRSLMHLKVKQFWRVECTVCSSNLLYYLEKVSEKLYLAQINDSHIHVDDISKYIKFLAYTKNEKFLTQMKRLAKFHSDNRAINRPKSKFSTILDFLNTIPNDLSTHTKQELVKETFGITNDELVGITSQTVVLQSSINFKELVALFQIKGYEYSYLPRNLLHEDTKDQETRHIEEKRDSRNPQLPNILLIVTQQMKQEYANFGHIVGFDLTFSLIKQKSENDKEYMIGVFSTFNNIRKITVLGFVITNSQSTFAYSFIFSEFFKIMNSVPKIIVTDEEKTMYYALKQLKAQGIFTGTHLLDMFHILRRFRKADTNSTVRQYFRELIHASNKTTYRKIFREALKEVSNDKEANLLRNFDLYSERYCYSQIEDNFVGIGISNSCNQMFHWLIKMQIRYALTYIKAVVKIMDIIDQKIIRSRKPHMQVRNFDQVLNVPFLKPYRTIFSSKVFGYLFKQVNRSATCRILPSSQIKRKSLRQSNYVMSAKNQYYVENQDGLFKVYKKTDKISEQETQKWYCQCKLEQRAGFLCCHIAKILMKNDGNFRSYFDKSWFIDQQGLNYKHLQMFTLKMQPKQQKLLCQQRKIEPQQRVQDKYEEYPDDEVIFYKLLTGQRL